MNKIKYEGDFLKNLQIAHSNPEILTQLTSPNLAARKMGLYNVARSGGKVQGYHNVTPSSPKPNVSGMLQATSNIAVPSKTAFTKKTKSQFDFSNLNLDLSNVNGVSDNENTDPSSTVHSTTHYHYTFGSDPFGFLDTNNQGNTSADTNTTDSKDTENFFGDWDTGLFFGDYNIWSGLMDNGDGDTQFNWDFTSMFDFNLDSMLPDLGLAGGLFGGLTNLLFGFNLTDILMTRVNAPFNFADTIWSNLDNAPWNWKNPF